MNSFVRLLSDDLEILVENSFYLSYYAGIQPSEVNDLTTYEFRRYLSLLSEHVKADRDRDIQVARTYGLGSIFGGGQKDNISQ